MTADPESNLDRTESLLGACLERSMSDWESAVERACAEHPEHAEGLRERFAALRAAGLVPDTDGPRPAEEASGDTTATDREIVEKLCREQPEVAAAFAEALDAVDVLPKDAVRRPLHEGRTIGDRYRVATMLGAGSMGAVYAAFDGELSREVAIKFLDARLFADPSSERRFLRESESLASLSHDHVVTVFDRGREDDGTLWLAMERLEGASLRDLLDSVGACGPADPSAGEVAEAKLGAPLPAGSWLRQAVVWTAELADGLGAAHDVGVFHRDVKPSNVFINRAGRAVLLDFGIATRADDASLTLSRSVLGTPCYMPPEQAAGTAEPAPTLDVYSLASTLYHLITGRPPFLGDPLEVLVQVRRDDPARPVRLRPDLPRDLQAVLEKGMERDPGRRYATMAEFADDLRAFLDHRPVSARPISRARRVGRAIRRRPAASLAGAALALAGLGFGVALPLWQAERDRERASEKLELVRELPALLAIEGTPEQRLFADLGAERQENVDRLTAILELDPSDLGMRLWRAALLLDAGRHDDASADLEVLAEQNESAYLSAVADRYRAASRDVDGVGAVNLEGIEVEPATSEERFVAGFHELRNRDVQGFAQRAEAHLAAAMDDYLPARDLRLLALLSIGDTTRKRAPFQEAYDESLKLAEIYGHETARTLAVRGVSLVMLQRYHEAVTALESSIELRPDRHGPWHNLGVAWRRLGRLERADQCLAKAGELRPHFWNTIFTEAQVLKDRGQFDAARALLEPLEIDQPELRWMKPYVLGGIAVEELGIALKSDVPPAERQRLADASVGYFDEARSLAPKSKARVVAVWRAVAQALAADDPAKIVHYLGLATAGDPKNAWLIGNLASLIPSDGLDAKSAVTLRVVLARIARSMASQDPKLTRYVKEAEAAYQQKTR